MENLRRERDESWKALGAAVGIPWRTLQDLASRLSKKDISQVKSFEKSKLEKVAVHWGIEYEDLFHEISMPEEAIDGLEELDDLEEIIADTEEYIAESGGNASEAIKEFAVTAKQTKFVFTGSFEAQINDFILASPDELNKLPKNVIFDFINRCAERERTDVAKRMTSNIIQDSDKIKLKTLNYFAIAMDKNRFAESEKLSMIATNRLAKLIER
jgi:hypothetical protein